MTLVQEIGDALVEVAGDINTLEDALADPVVGTQIAIGLNQRIHKETIKGPDWYPEFSEGPYLPFLNLYNAHPENMRGIAAGRARVMNGGAMHCLFLGDSLFVGTGATGTTVTERFSPPGVCGRLLGDALGVPRGGGIVPATSANGSSGVQSDRWSTVSGTPLINAPYLALANTVASQYTSLHTGTNIDMYISELGAAGTYTIDGGAPVSIGVGNGTSTVRKISVTGLADTTHTVKFTGSGGTNTWLIVLGVEVFRAHGIRIHNLSQGGSKASGTSNQVWTDTVSAGSVYLSRKLMWDASGFTPDVIFCDLGANDINASQSTATIIAALETMIGWYPNADWVFCGLWDVADVQVAAGEALAAAKYALCDEYDFPYIDLRHRYGTRAQANAAGLLGTDVIHPHDGTATDIGRNFAQVLAGDGPGFPRVVTLPAAPSSYSHLPAGTLVAVYNPTG